MGLDDSRANPIMINARRPNSEEFTIKTNAVVYLLNNEGKTIERIKQIHSYELPDIIVLPVVGGLKDYLEYVNNETA